jgi:hypothetical protein
MPCEGDSRGQKDSVRPTEPILDQIYANPTRPFSHNRHVLKGIACKTCHGAVETMDRVQKAVILDMDRCVACHMEKKASIDCLTCHQ